MLAKELISDVLPSVKTSDTGAQALSWMETFRVSHLPIVNNSDFLGLISDNDIYALDDVEQALGNHNLSLFSPFVDENQHIYEVIELISRLKLSVVPVVKEGKEYLGLISMHDLILQFAKLTSANQPGGILVLAMTVHDYSLTEISRIIEENNAKILSVYVDTQEDSMELELTIKVNTNDMSAIIRSLERYDYSIKASFLEDDKLDALYRDRYEEFMRFLNI
ncbi:MAG: CBS domain-containing protein [Bacteroidetes bacterium]|jgi:acetoin utilization protein AcuB|nr:CBS domain-containing protein [Bacteroidota bacterium]MBT3751641.1 CBS domain-containing protein [Bacteroidota bacterium]MBT4399460.1 CBS domain-containing protein [Bacteroidota bacterium]MBT4410000.1 CBS domain-containing protein [Bacteroidota bacterium]MBT5425939.1 CBS domain-containing protein [Bacteroidota bacterium]